MCSKIREFDPVREMASGHPASLVPRLSIAYTLVLGLPAKGRSVIPPGWGGVPGLNAKSKIQNARTPNPKSRIPNLAFTLMELIAAMAIMLVLTSIALPLARVHAQRLRELELRRDLRDLRQAIDHYKDLSDRQMIPTKMDTYGYPPDLDTLVKGVELKGAASTKYKFLRRIPVDP